MRRRQTGGGDDDLADKPTPTWMAPWRGWGKYQKQFSPEVFDRLTQELKNIYQAAGVGVSPLYGQYGREGVKTDYTQFTPRSHYAKTSLLRAYFRAMMYLGRNSYFLSSPEGISDALLLAHLMASPARWAALGQGLAEAHGDHRLLCRGPGRYRLPGAGAISSSRSWARKNFLRPRRLTRRS